MHPKDDVLRAYYDHELTIDQTQAVQDHLAHCQACSARLDELTALAQRVHLQMGALTLGESEQSPSPQTAYRRFTQNSSRFKQRKESIQTMFTRRPLWTALAIIAVIALVFTITPANAWASSFLGLFRVQKVQVVTFDPAAADNVRSQLKANQAAVEEVFKQDVKITEHGSVTQVASASEAAQKAGFTPRLPDGLTEFYVRPGMNAVFTINQPKLQALIDAVGANAKLPASVNGKTITADVPDAIAATSAGCGAAAKAGEMEARIPANCTTLIQVPSPVVNTPEGLNVQQLGQAMFQFLGVSESDAAQLSQRIDWTSTLILPIPQGSQIQYQDVQVDGVTGTFLQEKDQNSYSMIWVKNGVLYGLHGPGGLQDAQKLTASLH